MTKKLTFYIVVPTEKLLSKEKKPHFLTITCKKDEAFDFIIKLLKLEKLNHFQMWCELRGLDKDSEKAWNKYFNTCVTREEKQKYAVNKITYKLNDVASIMRMFGGCLPLGCKFDTPSEYEYLKYKLESQKMAEELSQAFKKVADELKEAGEEEKTDGVEQR